MENGTQVAPKKEQSIIQRYFTGALHEVNLRQIDFATKVFTLPFHIQDGKAVQSTGIKLILFWIIYFGQTLWTGTLLVRVVLRFSNIRQDVHVVYNLAQKVLDIGWLVPVLICNYVFKTVFTLKSKEVAYLINSAANLEKNMLMMGLVPQQSRDVVYLMYVILGYSSFGIGVIGIGGLVLMAPCMSIFFTSLILPCENGSRGVEYDPTTLLIVLPGAAVEAFFVTQIMGAGIVENVNLYGYLSADMKLFLKRLMKMEVQGMEDKLKIWRTFQVLLNLQNHCLGPIVIPTMISSWSLLTIIGTLTGLRLYGIAAFPLYCLFILLGIDGVVANTTGAKNAADVHDCSVKVLHSWKVDAIREKNGRRRLALKSLKSFGVLRVKIGSTNFYETTTPLLTLDFCVDQIVTLLIAI